MQRLGPQLGSPEHLSDQTRS